MEKDEGFLGEVIQYGVPILVAFLVFIVFMWAVNISKKESLKARLRRLAPSDSETKDAIDRKREGDGAGIAAVMEPFVGLVTNLTEFRRLNFYKFYRAGVDPVDGPVNYLAYKWITTPIAVLLIYVLWTTGVDEGMAKKMMKGVGTLLLIALSWFGPNLFLANSRAKRELLLMRSFPDTLDLLLVCTESGLALDGALARVCRELGHAYPEITDEMNKTRLELTLLNDREKALANLAERSDLVPFRSLVASLLQTERFGTSLTDTLRVLADEYRNTRLMLAEQKAGRLPVMMTVPLIVFLLPSLFLIILGPAVVSMLTVQAEHGS
ncbi:MAG: type II secretion system F family protein [Rickettsiales bacterium]|nr:type II secretion system F family protein [Rickettsiales bacterium]